MIRNALNMIRWPNLLMLAGIQALVYFRLLEYEQSVLSIPDLALMILITALIGASGYVINDYYDSAIDSINKPKNWIAGNIWALEKVRNFYLLLVFIGFCLSIWLAIRLDLLNFIFIYPAGITALWFYSYSLKCKPVIGNILVSLFCAGVVWIVALPDLLLDYGFVIKEELWYYIIFAFMTTWLREVVKDIEDEEGDARSNCHTAVVRFGLKFGKFMMVFLGVILIGALLVWDNRQSDNWMKVILTVLQGFTVASLAMVWWAKNNSYYHYASTIIKLVMVGGTVMLVWM